MPRTARKRSSTDVYHVIGRGINHERIFNQTREKNNFIRLLKKYLEKYDAEIYAYVIMSTHYHLLIHTDLRVLSNYIASVQAEFAEYYNYKHGRNGHVFQDRFRSECVETPQYFWNCVRYIHMNPVNANLVTNPLKYRFSSIKEYEIEEEKIIDPYAIQLYRTSFEDFDEYLEFHQKTQKYIFIDIPEEIERQMVEVGKVILHQETHRQGLEGPHEIIEDYNLREKYKKKIRNEFRISKSKTERLYQQIKRCIIEK